MLFLMMMMIQRNKKNVIILILSKCCFSYQSFKMTLLSLLNYSLFMKILKKRNDSNRSSFLVLSFIYSLFLHLLPLKKRQVKSDSEQMFGILIEILFHTSVWDYQGVCHTLVSSYYYYIFYLIVRRLFTDEF